MTVTREQWTTALRSGEYGQCRGRLYGGDNTYCCLGVLARLYGASTKENPPVMNIMDVTIIGMPTDAMINDMALGNGALAKIIEMNDDGKPFTEIADYLDSLPPKGG